ncbi:MAG: hypothetical protein ACOYKA_03035 [Legionellaceae bacterium]
MQSVDSAVREKKQEARRTILERTIAQDQAAILERWARTFVHVGDTTHPVHETHEAAVGLMMIAMAAVAQGRFEVSASGKNNTFTAPSHALCVADYVSHASRVMIDLKELSEENRKILSERLSSASWDGRASTHYLERDKDNELTEIKSKRHGLKETGKNMLDAVGKVTGIAKYASRIGLEGAPLTDYGVDILMGGVGQENLSGGISGLGKDGHVLIHRGEPNALMIGLEQTTPPGTNSSWKAGIGRVKSLVWKDTSESKIEATRKTPSPELSCDDDNTYGLSDKHSMSGTSDAYTSAGSLYFSNLIYQLKLLEEQQELVPAKYNGMRVHLTDGNFAAFLGYYQDLDGARKSGDIAAVKTLLQRLPETTRPAPLPDKARKNYLFLVKHIRKADLKDCFEQLKAVYGDEALDADKKTLEQTLDDIQDWLAEPRQLPRSGRVLAERSEDKLHTSNPFVIRLHNTLNEAVRILKEEAVQELADNLGHPSETIHQMMLLGQAYLQINCIEDAPVYQTFKTQEDAYRAVRRAIGSPDPSRDPQFPFGYLMSLKSIEKDITLTVNTNESRALIELMGRDISARQVISRLTEVHEDDLRSRSEIERLAREAVTEVRRIQERDLTAAAEREEQHAQHEAQLRASFEEQLEALRADYEVQRGTLTEEVEALRAECAAYEAQRIALRRGVEELRADFAAERIAIRRAQEELRRQSIAPERPPEVTPEAHLQPHPEAEAQELDIMPETFPPEAAPWDFAFVFQCLASPTAFNTYGALFMLAALLIAGATAAAVIPVVLGTTIAVSGVALSASCFFKAQQNNAPIPEASILEP